MIIVGIVILLIFKLLFVVVVVSYFSFQPVLHDWFNKARDMYCPVCGMVHIKEPLLLIRSNPLMAAAGFLSRSLNGYLPYVRRHITVKKMC